MAVAFTIRDAVAGDLAAICGFIRELAVYEKLEHEVTATPDSIKAALFGAQPKAFAFLFEVEGKAAGFCVCFYNFSTFLGRPGIYIEDIYVQPAYRGYGIGSAMFRHLAKKAAAEGCGRLEWSVLNWNAPALGFYASMGAKPMDEWQVQRVSGEALQALAS